ncbi:hypothetical protein [Okeania sp. SIO2B3]|uniref:hypothetical protein n=1 Tax=Okeania sp. SIO2B3 TaxID=2607784 RepID=UPI0013BF2AB8|nr:hypothetical protein [Okeania sp. SIO2B3]NET44412.1 hypothetical protein [Okeania sp. SIO2B3]
MELFNLGKEKLDRDSGTDKQINYLSSSVHSWQNHCLALFRRSLSFFVFCQVKKQTENYD